MNIDMLVASAEREERIRRKVYPGLVARKDMTQKQADYEIECMRQIVACLRRVQEGELLL